MSGRALLAAGLYLATAGIAAAQPGKPISVTIDATRKGAPVTRYEYGMFIEPIGTLVARSLWAEMLDDRKFYHAVEAGEDAPPPPQDPDGPPRSSWRKWRPIGDADAVSMDSQTAYVGKQSPRIALAGSAPRGLRQSGIGIAAGKRYEGHLWMSGSPRAHVEVALVWGDGAQQRQVFALPAPTQQWQRATFYFTPTSDADNARFEVIGTGQGSVRIDAVSLMPADNIRGWRADTTAIARSLNSGFWRMPGGNFLSNWDWHGALGPRDKRAPMYDHAWSTMQPNDIGMDEWLDLAKILNVEPYLTVDAGLGDANSAAEEVEYINGPATSHWGAMREANGHPEPYGVKYWNIGNEPYGWWQIGQTTRDYFMIKHNRFAEAMRAIDPSIILIGSGAMPDQQQPRGVEENPTMEVIMPRFGTEADWTGGLFSQAWGNFDGISEHWYDTGEKRPDAPADVELMEYVRSPSNQVRVKADQWHIYEGRFPAIREKGIFLSIDEYAYLGGANLKTALAYAMVMQEMLRHTGFLKMSAFTAGSSTMDITPTGAVLNSTGLIFKLFGEHFGAGTVPLAVDGKSPQPDPRYRVGHGHPQVKAGSPTYPLDVVAGLSPDGTALRIGVVNATFDTQAVALDGPAIRKSGRQWLLSGKALDARNVVGSPAGVTITEKAATVRRGQLSVPPLSASIFEFPLAGRR